MFVGFGVAELLGGFILCGIRLVESYGMGRWCRDGNGGVGLQAYWAND